MAPGAYTDLCRLTCALNLICEDMISYFDNPVLDTLFSVGDGCGHFLQFCDSAVIDNFRTTCFAALLEVKEFWRVQDDAAHPNRVPDPPAA